jgi:hypothetical protein
MHEFFVNSDAVISLIFAILDLLMCAFLIYRGIKRKQIYVFEMALVAFGLFYDAFICALSGFLPLDVIKGSTFKSFSQMRFVLHGALIPLLFPICGYAVNFKKKAMDIVYIITALFIILGVIEGMMTKLTLVTVGPITRYAMDKEATAKWVHGISSFITVFPIIPLVVAGVYVWIKRKTPFLFLSGFLMFLFAAVGAATKELNFMVSMIGEILMTLFFILYELWEAKHPREAKAKTAVEKPSEETK